MILNADSVLKQFLNNDLGQFGKKAQVGIDLSITNIRQIIGGKICQNGSKEIEEYQEVESYDILKNDKGEKIKTWILKPGCVYSLTFEQSIKLDKKHCGRVINKSTLLRLGCIITSGVYDPGFQSSDKGCGATLFCFNNVEIEFGSKLAQLVVAECEDSESYAKTGSYQGNKDKL